MTTEKKEYFYSADTYDAMLKINKAQEALANNESLRAVEYCIEALADVFSQLLSKLSISLKHVNIADMAFLIEKNGIKVDFAKASYNINNLRLKLLTKVSIDRKEVIEAINSTKKMVESSKEARVS